MELNGSRVGRGTLAKNLPPVRAKTDGRANTALDKSSVTRPAIRYKKKIIASETSRYRVVHIFLVFIVLNQLDEE